ncbi:delta-6 fatty acid desaturase [Tribonema minus]|uniref:Delta-6 fatty acid desaturase n=1 Tax=Tribonema minus TaxID=303371 RepID=A0A835YIW8_9STRA|nr:delta-6 fatty acid desaturase [Tribonema minus]
MGKGGRSAPQDGAGTAKRGAAGRALLGRPITMEEVRQHTTPEDAWMVYQNKVYDVSGWHDHPGGHVIFTHAGDDATDIFAAFHPPSAYKTMEPYCIGDLDKASVERKPAAQRDFERAYRDLRGKLVVAGMFNSSKAYYVWKCSSNLAIWAAGCLCVILSDSFAVHMLGAFLLALFWQQCGWLAHDFLHHQVFKNRAYGDYAGIFWGNIAQGFSVGWWKNKHNTHHAVPNLHASSPDAHDGDPDIDTMPLLAWSLKMAAAAERSAAGRFFVEHQAVLYFPILLIARISWLLQSLSFCFDLAGGVWESKGSDDAKRNFPLRRAEQAGMVVHYAWFGALLATQLSVVEAVVFFLAAQMMCGFMLALVFGLGHNGMATYDADARPDFWKLQVTTTRNVSPNLFVDWFCGGLQYQVDHHLFPSIPRHNLPKVHAAVAAFCKENGVEYHEASMLAGTVEVLSHLKGVSTQFIGEFPAM